MESDQTPMNIEEREARISEIADRQRELNDEYRNTVFPEHIRAEFENLADERQVHERAIAELAARKEYLREQDASEENRDGGAGFETARPGVVRGDDVYDLTTIRTRDQASMGRELRDRALRSVEGKRFPHPQVKQQDAQTHVEQLMERVQAPDHDPSHFDRYLLEVGSPTYERAWDKLVVAGMKNVPPMLSPEEQRAASIGTTTAGGFAVPYNLDPTIIPTGNWSVNPWRALSRVEQISGSNEWRGVSAGDMTATRRAEAAEVADNMVTLAQPTAICSRVDAFVPFSYEIDQDWGGFRTEVARLFSDAKDNEEATAFATGSGTGVNPQGVITGATNLVTTAGSGVFAIADTYALDNALPPRFQPNASIVAHRSQYNRVRQFDTAGGAGLWVQNLQQGLEAGVPTPGNTGYELLGYPASQCSALGSGIANTNKIMVLGDFRYYLIVDRIGMSVEVVQNLFATANLRPTGQRGLLAFWRNTGTVLSAAAFRVLIVL